VSDLVGQGKLLPVKFGNGKEASLSEVRSDDATDIIARMDLTPPANGRPVILVGGGAVGLADAGLERASAVLGAAVAKAAQVTGAVVVDGGTSAGVMRLTGQARARWPGSLPELVGVAPAGMAIYTGQKRFEISDPPADSAPLEENHSHFILADSDQWGGETGLMMVVAEKLAGAGRVAMVMAGGGAVARSEAAEAGRRGWPVFVIAGTGGLADSLSALWAEYRVPRRRLMARVMPAKWRHRKSPPLSQITDADLREIITYGDIRPVTVKESADEFAHELAWQLQEEPVLKDAWQRFATYDYLAIRLRRMFTRFQAAILALGVLATLLGLIDSVLKKTALHWAVIVVPILASVLLAVASRRTVGQRWVMLRAAAQSIKAEICRYRTLRMTSEDGQAAVSPAGQGQLVSQLEGIETRLMQTEVSGSPLMPYEGSLPGLVGKADNGGFGLDPLTPDRYLEIRVRDQIGYYHRRVRRLNRWRNALQLVAIVAGGTGAILAAANQEAWIGLTAGLSAAALAYLGLLQVDNTIVTYNQTASRLTLLDRSWQARDPAEQADPAAFDRLVTDCETALATELSGWVQQMNDTLEDLRRERERDGSPDGAAGNFGAQGASTQ
jgi:SLOG in TRPM, prokaryote/SMODS and SLOG-associating 2TM effector domain 1/Protein of unknown function (DUF4231)